MERDPPNLQMSPAGPLRLRRLGAAADALLAAALAAHRSGSLEELVRRQPRLERRLARRMLAPLHEVAGDALAGDKGRALAWTWLLRWAVMQLRPDGQLSLEGLERAEWLERTSWRPMIAVMCHHGFAPVAEFRDRYRARPDESAADHLCGLWSVGPSTFYRYVDKGRRLMAELLVQLHAGGAVDLSLRRLGTQETLRLLGIGSEPLRRQWHLQQADAALAASQPVAALWHVFEAGDALRLAQALQRHSIRLASWPHTDALLEQAVAWPVSPAERFELCLAQACLWRARHADERERQALEQALRHAAGVADHHRMGVAYSALGKFHESRDADRALACYQDAAEQLRLADAGAEGVLTETLTTLTRLAWLYLLRNDPRARTVLETAAASCQGPTVPDDALAMLEQTWGEYFRRAGDWQRALEHKHRALNIYERLGDSLAVLKTYTNLGLIYADAKDFDRAVEYSQKVLAMTHRLSVEPETTASAHLNLGVAYFWQGRYDEAIEQYEQGLALSRSTGLKLHMRRAHYNLAEAWYFRCKQSHDPQDERRGDEHAAAALQAWPEQSDPASVEAARNLKRDILGPRDVPVRDRLLPSESAAHFPEMAEVDRQRALLALPMAPQARVRAHLAIANAYVAMATQEREAARRLVAEHGLGDAFAEDFDRLRTTFDRELLREQQLAAAWQRGTSDLWRDERGMTVLQHVLRSGWISKSSYAELCAVGLATASKHLGLLAERGLLVQTGKGPATRYLLPQAGPQASPVAPSL